ncbi:hypothetical protein DSO57_1003307 [Entomophthora muscae]|uniref:Uncharacterized protein n=1 Tax=Entomophthora muscae TaxID=34485 RepID=A0ACC2T8G6_9FUNG|nr:hypothetical protein DSO57_1003307 [Entomophthora muscae]
MTPKPMPTSAPNLPTNHTSKLFGIVYITLTGMIDTIIPAAGPWSWVGKSASYLLNLAPFLWWALPAKNPAQFTPENDTWPPKTGSLTIGVFGGQFFPSISYQEFWISELADYFLANKLLYVVSSVYLYFLGYWLSCSKFNGGDDIFLFIVFSWHGANNVKNPYFEK